ncbi:MAG: hypothetical protein ACXVJD_01430 [Mucilaginibacter sp.]
MKQQEVSKPTDSNVPAPVDGDWAILKQQMVNQLPKREVFNTVLISVARAFADMNVKDISDDDRDYLVNELTENIIKYHPAIRLNEIPEAMALGIRGAFGEFYGFSVVTFERFIGQYLLSEKRTRLVKELQPDDPQRTAPDLPTQFATARYNALQALQRKKEGRDLSSIATLVYTFLDRLKLLQFAVAEKHDMMADATRELVKELQLKLMTAREGERNEIRNDIAAYTKAITEHAPVNTRQASLVKMRAKKLALDAFLNNLLLEEGDLEEMIESRKNLFIQA